MSAQDWLGSLTLADLIRLHDETNAERLRCEAEARPQCHLTDAENMLRCDEATRDADTARRANELILVRLAMAGQLLFTLATESTLPGLIEDAVERLATTRLKGWLAAVDVQVKRLVELHGKMAAKCDYLQRVIEDGPRA